MMTIKSKSLALVVFLTVWALSILALYHNYDLLVYPIVIVGLIYEIFTTKQPLKVLVLITTLGFLGWLFQSFEAYLGTLVIKDSAPFAPIWLGFLWALFMSSTLRTMPFVFNNIFICFLIGCYSLPGTYLFISKIGLAKIKTPLWQSLALDSIISGVIFLITYFLLKIYFYKKGNLYV
jgi:hypothetical protein